MRRTDKPSTYTQEGPPQKKSLRRAFLSFRISWTYSWSEESSWEVSTASWAGCSCWSGG